MVEVVLTFRSVRLISRIFNKMRKWSDSTRSGFFSLALLLMIATKLLYRRFHFSKIPHSRKRGCGYDKIGNNVLVGWRNLP